ncbi:MAG: hypothetical protein Q8L48_11610 [Archangium sp.]|nr:hypothetical protein [Archangium sp.]
MELESALRRLLGEETITEEPIEWSPEPFGRPPEPDPGGDEPL